MAPKQSWEKNNLPLKPERRKKAEQLFLVQVAQQAPQHHVPGSGLQRSIGKPQAQRGKRCSWFLKQHRESSGVVGSECRAEGCRGIPPHTPAQLSAARWV